MEKAKLDPMFRVEYMSYYANLADHQAALKKAREEGREEEHEAGLAALVDSLKPLLPDFDAVYDAIIKNKAYSDCTREEVKKYF